MLNYYLQPDFSKSNYMSPFLKTILPLAILLSSCNTGPYPADIEKWKAEVAEAERSFAKMAKTERASQLLSLPTPPKMQC